MDSKADLGSAEKKEFLPLQRIELRLHSSSARSPVTVLIENGEKLIEHGMTFFVAFCCNKHFGIRHFKVAVRGVTYFMITRNMNCK
jgi:hypothetical protein